MQEDLKKLISLSTWYIGLQLLTLVAFISVGAVLYLNIQEIRSSPPSAVTSAAGKTIKNVPNWRTYIREHSPSQGAGAARVVVVEFSDFQCPYCKVFNDGARRDVLVKYADRIRWVFKHLPLDQIHPNATRAAIAAQCGHRQGKFWDLHDAFFERPGSLSENDILVVAKSLGLGDDFTKCLIQEETELEVKGDVADGLEIGVQGTPAFLINGNLMAGVQTTAQLEKIIDGLLDASAR